MSSCNHYLLIIDYRVWKQERPPHPGVEHHLHHIIGLRLLQNYDSIIANIIARYEIGILYKLIIEEVCLKDLVHFLKTNKISLMFLYEFEDLNATERKIMWLKPHIVGHETHLIMLIIEVLASVYYHPLLCWFVELPKGWYKWFAWCSVLNVVGLRMLNNLWFRRML